MDIHTYIHTIIHYLKTLTKKMKKNKYIYSCINIFIIFIEILHIYIHYKQKKNK